MATPTTIIICTSFLPDKLTSDSDYLHVGALSFFALQAGARKVYAIEASNMSEHCKKLVRENNLSDKMTVVNGKVEEVRKMMMIQVERSGALGERGGGGGGGGGERGRGKREFSSPPKAITLSCPVGRHP